MQNLRVFIAATDTGYRANLFGAGGNVLDVAGPFTPFLRRDDYEDLRWYLEDYMELPDGGAVAGRSASSGSSKPGAQVV